MRTWQLVVVSGVVALAATGCKKKLHWQDQRAPTVSMAGFTITIPAGWRDSVEAHDEELNNLLAKQPGAHAFVQEDFDGKSIIVKSGDAEPSECNALAAALAKAEQATATEITAGQKADDPTCQFTYGKEELKGHYYMRFHGGKLVAVMCFVNNDAKALAACTATIDSIK